MSQSFPYDLDFDEINFRERPDLYRIGKGEQGVLMVEPYKSEILPYWKFKAPEEARESSRQIYELFEQYKQEEDFVGMDMARKFLQMGFTRARRYANHPSGKKYDEDGNVRPQAEGSEESEKAESARIFYKKYAQAKDDPVYQRLKQEHRDTYERTS
ncbi:MAG: DUF4385 domain-containing protein [Candidatus Paceibacteria bacterium]